jgi:hypothetical protein
MIYSTLRTIECKNCLSVGLDTGIPGDTLFRFWRRDYGLMWRLEWFKLLGRNTLHLLSLYCSLGELLYRAGVSLNVCVCVYECVPREVVDWALSFYRPRAQIPLGEYIEVMTPGYRGPCHVNMPSVATCSVDLSSIMISNIGAQAKSSWFTWRSQSSCSSRSCTSRTRDNDALSILSFPCEKLMIFCKR